MKDTDMAADPHHTPVAVDPQELDKAQHGWRVFTEWAKWGVLGVCILLLLMGAVLL